jgi:hypothetical protein
VNEVRSPISYAVNEADRIWSACARYAKYLRYRRGSDLVVDGWRFNNQYGLIYFNESRGSWRNYLTPEPLGDVVDIGAGCGETAKLFLEHGARSIVAVENNPECFPYLKENAVKHGFRVWLEDFNPERLLDLRIDTLKLDIEGWELLLLPYLDRLKYVNIVLETHCDYITQQFLKRGFSKRDVNSWGVGYIYRWRR